MAIWEFAASAALKIGQNYFGAQQNQQQIQNQVNAYNTQNTNSWLQSIYSNNAATDAANMRAEAAHNQAVIDAAYARADAKYATAFQNELIEHANNTTAKNYGIQLDLFGEKTKLNNIAAAEAYAANETRLQEIYTAANYQAARNQRSLATAMVDAGYQAEQAIQNLRFATEDENLQQAQLVDESLSRFSRANVDIAKQQNQLDAASLSSAQSVSKAVEDLRNFNTSAAFTKSDGRRKLAAAKGRLQAADEGNRGESYERFVRKSTDAATGIAEAQALAQQQQAENAAQLSISGSLRNSLNQARAIQMNQFGILSEVQNAERMSDLQSVGLTRGLRQKNEEFDLGARQLAENINETQKQFGISSNELIDSILSAEGARDAQDRQVTIQAANQQMADWSQVMIPPAMQLKLPEPNLRKGPGAFQKTPYAAQAPMPTPVKSPSFNQGMTLANALLAGGSDLIKIGSSALSGGFKPEKGLTMYDNLNSQIG